MAEPAATPEYAMIRDFPPTDRPRERLRDFGASALSVAELIAILLRVGGAKENAVAQAQRLVRDLDGLEGINRASFAELCTQKGIGEAKAAQIKAALELGMRLLKDERPAKSKYSTPEDIADLVLAEMSMLDQEQVRVALLDPRGGLISLPTVYVGSAHTTQVRMSELLSEAVRAKATSIVLIHNHPSGDPTPSSADGIMTRQLYDSAKIMDIELYDHIVIGGGRYVSMRATGLGFPKAGSS